MNYWLYESRRKAEDLVGKTFTKVYRDNDHYDNEAIVFEQENGTKFVMTHLQDCCESVEVEEISGDLEDLVGSPIVLASERTSDDFRPAESYDTQTWTFYIIGTVKGTVNIRWYGTSNGYYSEDVDIFEEKVKE